MLKIYGIPNCDIVKKAVAWLKKNKIPFAFHDYKKEGAPVDRLLHWMELEGWEKIFNKRSTTWKELLASGHKDVTDARQAIAVMEKNTSIIKRPVIEYAGKVLVGFDENDYIQQLIKK